MVKTGNYVHGTAAEKIQYDVYQENRVLKNKKKQKSYHKVKAKAVMAVMIVFGLGFAVMYRYAAITELNYKINKNNKVYSELQKDNSRLKIEVDNSMDLEKIKEVAENRLGMQKLDKSQTVRIAVPKSDYTNLAEEYKADNASTDKLSAFLDKLEKFTRLLY